MLERFGCYGKAFVDAKTVHPLLFSKAGGGTRRLNPARMPLALGLRFPQRNHDACARGFRLLQPLLATSDSKARLRLTEYRGKFSATMCHDQRSIHDVFHRVDDNTVLGAVDMKACPRRSSSC